MTANVNLGSQAYKVLINPANFVSIDGGSAFEVLTDELDVVFRFSETFAMQFSGESRLAAIEGDLILEVSINDDCFAQGREIIVVRSLDLFTDVDVAFANYTASPMPQPDPAPTTPI